MSVHASVAAKISPQLFERFSITKNVVFRLVAKDVVLHYVFLPLKCLVFEFLVLNLIVEMLIGENNQTFYSSSIEPRIELD